MQNRTTVINTALRRLGAQGGNMAFAGTPGEQMAEAAYGSALDYCLSLHDWPFAVRLARLAREAGAPAFGYRYAYTLPGDCLRVIMAREHDAAGNAPSAVWRAAGPEFRIVGYSIHTDAPSLAIQYVSNDRNMGFDALFADALAWRLGLELSAYLPQGAARASDFLELFEAALDRAKLENDIQQPVRTGWISRVLEERHAGEE